MGEAGSSTRCEPRAASGKKDTGALSGIHPQELLAQCLQALPERNGFDPNDVEDVVAGCVSDVERAGRAASRAWPCSPRAGTPRARPASR